MFLVFLTSRYSPEERLEIFRKYLNFLVGARGFEPPTPCTPCKCATRLRHAPFHKDNANILFFTDGKTIFFKKHVFLRCFSAEKYF